MQEATPRQQKERLKSAIRRLLRSIDTMSDEAKCRAKDTIINLSKTLYEID